MMEFQLSFFKSWKIMLLECWTQYASKFGKLSNGPRTDLIIKTSSLERNPGIQTWTSANTKPHGCRCLLWPQFTHPSMGIILSYPLMITIEFAKTSCDGKWESSVQKYKMLNKASGEWVQSSKHFQRQPTTWIICSNWSDSTLCSPLTSCYGLRLESVT